MIVVDVLLAANLAVLAVLVVADRSSRRRGRPAEVLAAARQLPREAVKSPTRPGCTGVVIPFDRAARRRLDGAMARHPAGQGIPSSR
jgi:hypothetical protein